MPIEYKKSKKETVFSFNGYIEMEECQGFLEAAGAGLDRQITLDMHGCDGVHTAVLQAIISLVSTAKKKGLSLRLLQPPGTLPGIFAKGGFEDWLKIN